jgi:hypothetical protein
VVPAPPRAAIPQEVARRSTYLGRG